jgi:hypothetical protein
LQQLQRKKILLVIIIETKNVDLHVPKLVLQNAIDVKVPLSNGTAHTDQNAYVPGNKGPWPKAERIRRITARIKW